jgi:DNA invertase Pin-like site-specific DNA recombinase
LYASVRLRKWAGIGLGEAAQRVKITAAASVEGWDLVGLKIDRGETGNDTDRPAFVPAVQRIADGEADGLIAAKLDRAARSVIDFASMLAWFTAGGKVLEILDPAEGNRMLPSRVAR